MAKSKDVSLVKVKAEYPVSLEMLDLWGYQFKLDGNVYIAELTEAEALALVDVGRVVLV